MTAPIEAPPPHAPAPTRYEAGRGLDRSLMHGLAWVGGTKWLTQLFSWGATIVIARVLTPEPYGIMAMANVYLGFVQLVNEFGLGAAIIRERDLTEEQISALGGLTVGLGLVLALVSVFLAIPVAAFYHVPVVRWIITILSLTFITTGLRVLPRSLLTRDHQFKRVATIDAIEALTTTTLTLILALLGLGYWSIVIAGLVASVAATVVAMAWRPHPRHWPKDISQVASSIRFGWHIVVSRTGWYFYNNADFAVVGRLFNATVLAGYAFAWNIASIPVSKISGLVGEVMPSIFSAVQTSQEQLRRYFLTLSEGLAFITFPFSIGVGLVARYGVLVALGPTWEGAIVPLQLLAFYAGIRSITTLHSQVMNAVGRSRVNMWLSILTVVTLPPLFYVGAKVDGVAGVAWAWIIGYPLTMILPSHIVFRVMGLRWSQYLSVFVPATMGCGVMVAAVLAVRAVVPVGASPLVSLLVESTTGAVAYAAVMFGLYRNRIQTLRAVVKDLRG